MKSLLLIALLGGLVFLAYQNHTKELAIKQLAGEREAIKEEEREAEMKDQSKKVVSEREAAFRERDNARREGEAAKQELARALTQRDEARQQVVAANAEIGRLTATTPKPVSWFEQRLNDSTTRLDAAPKTSPGVRPRIPTSQ